MVICRKYAKLPRAGEMVAVVVLVVVVVFVVVLVIVGRLVLLVNMSESNVVIYC